MKRRTSASHGARACVLLVWTCLWREGWTMHGAGGRVLRTVRKMTVEPTYQYRTEWYDQTLDHFGSEPTVPSTFKQRYLVNDTWWDKENGPVFFYTGNEGNVEMFCQNTGFVWDIAPTFNALVVFAEHRYYGQSMPFGKEVFNAPVDIRKLKYLSVEQALADFVALIQHIRVSEGAKENSVIAFGGSYGGMLTAWLRLKYPWAVDGGIASSAPVIQFGNLVPTGIYAQIVTENFDMYPGCAASIRRSWDALKDESKSEEGLQFLTDNFKSCKPLKAGNAHQLRDWLASAYDVMPMVNYPYPTDFISPLPGHPVEKFCSFIEEGAEGRELLQQVANGAGMYYNYSGSSVCNDIVNAFKDTDLDDIAWDYQACTEMVMPMSTDGVNDMFWPSPWNLTDFQQGCQKRWGGAITRATWAILQFGGRDIGAGSNIVFSNGLLDPWHGGSILKPPGADIVVLNINGAPHHFDLRSSNPDDPPSVVAARQVEVDNIWYWVLTGTSSRKGDRSYSWDTPSVRIAVMGVLLGLAMGSVIMAFASKRLAPSTRRGERGTQPESYPLLEPLENNDHGI